MYSERFFDAVLGKIIRTRRIRYDPLMLYMGDYMNRFLYAILIVIGVLLLPRVLELIFPFIIGFILYLICRRPVRRMAGAGVNRSIAAIFTLFFALALAGAVCALIFAAAYGERERLPGLYRQIYVIQSDNSLMQSLMETLREELSEAARSITMSVISHMGDITEIIMILFFAVLSAFFFLRDEERLVDIMLQNGGDSFFKNVQTIKETAGSALIGYIRAQAILMVVTFCILSIFLVLFGVKYAVLIALGIAFLDAIPIFGTGFILLPWAAWQFLSNNPSMGFGLLALYGACSLTRQILEPKILSTQIGLHPLLTLTGIFLGFKLFGVLGLIIGPAAMLIIVTFVQKRG